MVITGCVERIVDLWLVALKIYELRRYDCYVVVYTTVHVKLLMGHTSLNSRILLKFLRLPVYVCISTGYYLSSYILLSIVCGG